MPMFTPAILIHAIAHELYAAVIGFFAYHAAIAAAFRAIALVTHDHYAAIAYYYHFAAAILFVYADITAYEGAYARHACHY